MLQNFTGKKYWVSRSVIAIWLMFVWVLPTQAHMVMTMQESEATEPSTLTAEPKPELERPTKWGEPTEVQVGVFVLDVDELDFADQSFAASVYYEVRWQSPFLRHEGPGPLHRGLTEVWNPRPAISGLQMAWKSFPENRAGWNGDLSPKGLGPIFPAFRVERFPI